MRLLQNLFRWWKQNREKVRKTSFYGIIEIGHDNQWRWVLASTITGSAVAIPPGKGWNSPEAAQADLEYILDCLRDDSVVFSISWR